MSAFKTSYLLFAHWQTQKKMYKRIDKEVEENERKEPTLICLKTKRTIVKQRLRARGTPRIGDLKVQK